MRVIKMIVISGVLMCCGCASIVSRSHWPVTITSVPTGATVSVKDESGVTLTNATTPATITLHSSSGFFTRAKYNLLFEKNGYSPTPSTLSARINGWYFGNIIGGGALTAVGLLIVDPATGAMWKLGPAICTTLVEVHTPPPQTESITTQLKNLKELKDANILNEEEYESRRKALVNKLQ